MKKAQVSETYRIERMEDSERYRVLCDSVEIATDLTFREAVTLVENTMYCKEDTDCHGAKPLAMTREGVSR